MATMNKHNNVLAFMLLVIAATAAMFFVEDNKWNEKARIKAENDEKIRLALENTPVLAKAVSVFNITENRKIYGKNDDAVLPIASLAKIMTVVEGLRGRDMNEIVYISPEAVKQVGDFGIFAFEKWRLEDLAKFTLVVSANDGAFALSEREENFLVNVNDKVRRLGAANTIFTNPTGLDIYTEDKKEIIGAGVFATAGDVNAMAIYAMKAYPEVFSATTLPELNLKSESGFEHNFKNTNILIGKIPNLLFSKTGFTETAGGSLAIIFRDKNDHDIAVTILGSTFNGRFDDMEKIVNVLYSN